VTDWAGFRFQDPAWLWVALAAPLVLLAAWWRERDVLARAVAFPGASRLRRARPGWRVRLRHLPITLAAFGLAAGALALARPQHGTLREDVTTRGVDIVVSLDVSGTMAAGDFQPRNRLEVAKDVVAEFVKRRTSDRVGLVVFAGRSLTKSPPTTDTAVLLRQLDDVRLEMLPDGTAIGSGLATALTRLRRSEAKSKVVVLVTDGDNNAGEIDPATAADMAKAMEVRVYTILVGRGGRVPMPVRARDPFTGAVVTETVMADVKVNPELLKQIAERTGAEFFRAEDPEALRQVFERIDKLEKSEIQVAAYRRYRELFPPALALCAALLAAAGLAWASGLRVVPA
jgi:Ca-activated chloride channel family protein